MEVKREDNQNIDSFSIHSSAKLFESKSTLTEKIFNGVRIAILILLLVIFIMVAVILARVDKVYMPSSNDNQIVKATTRRPQTLGECGKRMISEDTVDSFIINGQDTVRGEWPWHVALIYNKTVLMNGVLISKEWVATSGFIGRSLNETSLIEVIAGTNTLIGMTSSRDAQIKQVDRVEHHRYWSFEQTHYINDIALLHLTSPLTFTDTVQAVCLPEPSTNISKFKNCIHTGYGAKKREDISDYVQHIMNKGKMFPYSYSICVEEFKMMMPTGFSFPPTQVDFEHFFCAGTRPMHSDSAVHSCDGDGGGPLMCEDTDQTWKLIGISSFLYGKDCQMSFFTRITTFVDWIRDKIGEA